MFPPSANTNYLTISWSSVAHGSFNTTLCTVPQLVVSVPFRPTFLFFDLAVTGQAPFLRIALRPRNPRQRRDSVTALFFFARWLVSVCTQGTWLTATGVLALPSQTDMIGAVPF